MLSTLRYQQNFINFTLSTFNVINITFTPLAERGSRVQGGDSHFTLSVQGAGEGAQT